MRTMPKTAYFFSTESYANGLPCQVSYVRNLRAKSNPEREVVLVECDKKVPGYKSKFLVLIPRHQGASFADLAEGQAVFAHVLDGEELRNLDEVDLSQGSRLIADIGGLAVDEQTARTWQVDRQEDLESAEFEKQLRSSLSGDQ